MRSYAYFAFTALLSGAAGAAHAETVLSVSYALPSNYKTTHEEIARRFQAEHPDIRMEFRPPLNTYDDVINDLMRSNITNDVPDVAFVGVNHIQLIAERGLATPLDTFVTDVKEWDSLGYYPDILSLGTVGGHQYGIPFAISLPVLHVNVDLVRRAGGSLETFPTTWEGIAELGQKIAALDPKLSGFTFQYDAWGNWTLQGLINSAGGKMADQRGCVGFDTPQGRWALDTLEMFHKKGVPELSWQQVQQAFMAGTVGIAAASSSIVVRAENQIGVSFTYKTLKFPMKSADGKLPGGGTMLVVTAKDPERQKAAWEYAKFATGSVAQTIMAKNSGYSPVSRMAVETPGLLGDYFKAHPNQVTAAKQLDALSSWHIWAGPNGIKIFSVVQNHIDALITGKATADDTMPRLVSDIEAMLPECRAGN